MTKTPKQAPQPNKAAVESPLIAPAAAPLCYVVDEDPSIRHFLSLVLHAAGIDTVEFASGAALARERRRSRTCSLISRCRN